MVGSPFHPVIVWEFRYSSQPDFADLRFPIFAESEAKITRRNKTQRQEIVCAADKFVSLTGEYGIENWDDPEYSTIMTTQLTVDGAGRIVIPKPLRKELDIGPGDLLEMESAGERITLRPLRGGSPLTKEKGVWVFRTGHPLPASATDELLNQIRQERDQQNLGTTK